VKINIICCFEPDVLSNFKAFVAEIRIWASLKIVFLESTVHKLSVDASLVHYLAVRGDKKQFIPGA
jgi:hypothetical protein